MERSTFSGVGIKGCCRTNGLCSVATWPSGIVYPHLFPLKRGWITTFEDRKLFYSNTKKRKADPFLLLNLKDSMVLSVTPVIK